ncbi:MAG: hypothetical protein A2174_01385 [Candidatus Portnoybacteria bacterium RBG_13_41_18]|uniref:Uncharacterized protein n=1 Tax=Candidatus Portnoybacteria bacterium RBG_13_41_18 TaxID=1801991 RepID=A0A1G2F5U9_9BACT|nr:MAG: hypothetical protein A2174_01385 [Candidatus Portnoybacteria bacterium RBG_13_41_18]
MACVCNPNNNLLKISKLQNSLFCHSGLAAPAKATLGVAGGSRNPGFILILWIPAHPNDAVGQAFHPSGDHP